jgi:uncharacterized protein involved in exopolysaccharide biosynthesis
LSNSPTEKSPVATPPEGVAERLVYVMPEHAFGNGSDEISLRDLWDILWRGKWIIIAITAVFAAASVLYALAAEEWYRAETVLAPADERSAPALGGQLGGLAALAGVTVGGGDSAQAVATLRSRELAREFIEDHDLVRVFFADEWDEERGTWTGDDPARWPDVRSAVKFFHENVLYLNQDRQTGLVTLAIEWKDPEIAAAWAADLVRRANETLRERALREAETNVAYLQAELSQTTLVTLQQSIGRLLESELQKLMLARGNEEFAFKVIDAASAPRDRIRPKRALISVVGTMAGGMFAVFLVFLLHALRGQGAHASNGSRREAGGI